MMQEAFNMKRILGLILVCCLVFSLFAEALAEPNWEITQQTKIETNTKKKTITLSVKVKSKGKIQYKWVFVNPENPEDTVTGKKISSDKRFKGIKVSGATKNKLVLSKIPEALHGWSVYCHLYSSNAYFLDTDPVVISVPGLEPIENAEASSGKSGDEGETTADSKDTAKKEEGGETGDEEEGDYVPAEPKDFTVTANGKYLFKIDSLGNPEGTEGASSLTFTDSGNVAVRSEEAFRSWTVNGVRFEPEGEINGFKMFNLSSDTSISLKVAAKTAASAKIDESVTLQVTCQGCSFTYLPKGLKKATQGEVPSGAVIYVFADSSEAAASGYSINGGEAQSPGASSIQVTVTEDTTIAVR